MRKLFISVLILFSLCSSVFAGSQQTSSTTGTAMIALARDDYNDTGTNQFDDTDILQYINDGMVDIAIKAHCYETNETIALLANTVEYAITAQYTEIKAVQYFNGVSYFGLKKGAPGNIGLSTDEADTDAPAFWYEFNGKIGIYPVLSSVTTQTVILYLARRPSAITAGQTITTPAIYDNALKFYIVGRMALKDKNTALYAALMGQYEKELGFYRQDLQEKAK